ncbi:MAG: N utilization substance protein A [Parcubacteria group bacterium Gr01-1014_70]|nr:MAG: N utilization substance protein A [Parcubacteria group bacterium Gr01-1014_70]
MMDLKTIHSALEQLAEEKGISREKVVETIEMALAAAYKKEYGKKGQMVKAHFNPETGAVSFSQIKMVVDETMIKSEEEMEAEELLRQSQNEEAVGAEHKDELPRRHKKDDEDEYQTTEEGGEPRKVRFNPERHIMLKEARDTKKDAAPGEELVFLLEAHEDFGRIAAQTAKQVIIQRIREAEREAVYDEYQDREGEIVSGIVQRVEGRNVFVDLGRSTAILPPEEQISFERYRIGERIKAVLLAVEKNTRGLGLHLSRSHPRFVAKLFELEVPEIAAGTVEVRSIAREAGSRSKIAVVSNEEGVDPVGSCVGQKGVRVSTVIGELGGEKIDIIEWDDDPARFIANSLSPARVVDIDVNQERKEARAIVAEDQLSLAIGKGGQNVRLAAKLTGWRIDVRSRSGEQVVSSDNKEDQEKEHIPSENHGL